MTRDTRSDRALRADIESGTRYYRLLGNAERGNRDRNGYSAGQDVDVDQLKQGHAERATSARGEAARRARTN